MKVQKVILVLTAVLFFSVVLLKLEKKEISTQANSEIVATSSLAVSESNQVRVLPAPVAELSKEPTVRDKQGCDFSSLKNYAESILARPFWKEVLLEYSIVKYKELPDTELPVVVNNNTFHHCALEVTLASKPFSYNEFTTLNYPTYKVLRDVLEELNPDEDYSNSSVVFSPSKATSVAFTAADGPNTSSYGTYIFNKEEKTVRLFSVKSGTKRTRSVYEVDYESDMCPCSQEVTITMTDEIPVNDFVTH